MKYIKSYKIYENSNFIFARRIKMELNDILIPFNDDDIKYQIYENINQYTIDINIIIEDKSEEYVDGGLKVTKKFFTWEKVKHEMLHTFSFLESEGFRFSKLEVQQILDGEFHNHEIHAFASTEMEFEFEDSFKFAKFEVCFSKLNDRS